MFLVAPNRDSALCTSCHAPEGWGAAAHRTSPAAWNGLPPDPWPRSEESTVSANACESCHRPHQAQAPQRLMSFPLSEAGCLSCHNGNVAAGSIAADLGKLSVHPVAATELHDPTEDPLNPPRHVECVDCHNPHAATAGGSAAPYASGALKGVPGVGAAGNPVAEVGFEYELCFRCHADSTARGAPLVARQFNQTNTRLEFSASSRSTHAVVVPGTNPSVPSLLSPYTPSSILSCTDCHNSNSAPASGGAGPNGPHGSLYRPILARQFAFADGSTESAANYALCYKCHSRTSILSETGSFKFHKKHLDARASCSTCHDPHGVENGPHLINFNTQVVTPSSGGRLEFVDTGLNKGSCFLTCHRKNHNPLSY